MVHEAKFPRLVAGVDIVLHSDNKFLQFLLKVCTSILPKLIVANSLHMELYKNEVFDWCTSVYWDINAASYPVQYRSVTRISALNELQHPYCKQFKEPTGADNAEVVGGTIEV